MVGRLVGRIVCHYFQNGQELNTMLFLSIYLCILLHFKATFSEVAYNVLSKRPIAKVSVKLLTQRLLIHHRLSYVRIGPFSLYRYLLLFTYSTTGCPISLPRQQDNINNSSSDSVFSCFFQGILTDRPTNEPSHKPSSEQQNWPKYRQSDQPTNICG